jgi:carbon monoxide dehydrogenase subunit G
VIASCTVHAPAAAWARLHDGAAVAAAVPGGVRGATRGDGAVELVVDVALGAAAGRLGATATAVAPGAVRIVGEGVAGTVDVVVRADPASGAIDVEGDVGGPLGTVGSGLLAAWVARTAQALLDGLAVEPAKPSGSIAEVEAEALAAVAAPMPPSALGPAGPSEPPQAAGWSPLKAAVAVAGALAVGFLAGRRRRSS